MALPATRPARPGTTISIQRRADRGATRGDGTSWLGNADGAALLATDCIATVESHRCADVESAVAAEEEIGVPIALKADFPPPAHAGDIDAVLLGLAGEEAVRAAWRELERRVQAAGRPWTGAAVQPLVAPGAASSSTCGCASSAAGRQSAS